MEASWNPFGNWNFFGKKPSPTLLQELNQPELNIKTAISPYTGLYHGDGEPHPIATDRQKETLYSFTYYPPLDRKKKGKIILYFRTPNSSDQPDDYEHWIYWDTDMKESQIHKQLNEYLVKALFNHIYKEIYGENLEWFVRHKVIPRVIAHADKNDFSAFEMYDALSLNELLFKTEKERLRQLMLSIIKRPYFTPANWNLDFYIPEKMNPVLRKILSESADPEEQIHLSSLELTHKKRELSSLYDTPEKIKTVDISSIAPELIVDLLRTDRIWREALTPEQVRQLDVRAKGIQYVFAPKYRDFRYTEPDNLHIDTLSDEQVMNIDRDTFLRDIFLLGELYFQGGYFRSSLIGSFIEYRTLEVLDKGGPPAMMKESLSETEYQSIAESMGFDMKFEDMKAPQRRELFKSQIAMMTNYRQQMEIVTHLVVDKLIACRNEFSEEPIALLVTKEQKTVSSMSESSYSP